MQFVPNFGRIVPAVAQVIFQIEVEIIYLSEVQFVPNFVPVVEKVILHIAEEVIYYK